MDNFNNSSNIKKVIYEEEFFCFLFVIIKHMAGQKHGPRTINKGSIYASSIAY